MIGGLPFGRGPVNGSAKTRNRLVCDISDEPRSRDRLEEEGNISATFCPERNFDGN